MKGVANIEFMIAGVTFLTVIIYLMLSLNSDVSAFQRSTESSIRVSQSYRLLFSLFFHPGEPEWWSDPVSAEYPAVGKGPWSIDEPKLAALTSFCQSDYVSFTKKVGAVYYTVRELTGEPLYACPASQRRPVVSAVMEMSGRPVKVEVGVV